MASSQIIFSAVPYRPTTTDSPAVFPLWQRSCPIAAAKTTNAARVTAPIWPLTGTAGRG
jgi:hypothetical protein